MSRNSHYYTKSLSKGPRQTSTLFQFGVVKKSDAAQIPAEDIRAADGTRATESGTTAGTTADTGARATDSADTPARATECLADPPAKLTVCLADTSAKVTECLADPPAKVTETSAETPASTTESAGTATQKTGPIMIEDDSMDVDEHVANTTDSSPIAPPGRKSLNQMKYGAQHPWAYHSVTKKGYMCKYCELFSDGRTEMAFTQVGAVLGQHPSRKLTTHANSKRHKISVERYAQMNAGQLGMLQKMIAPQKSVCTKKRRENRDYLKKVMKMTRFLVNKKWGFTENVRDLATLFADMGDEQVARFLKQDINYLSSTSVTEIVETMSTHRVRKVMADMRGKPFTLLLDESTDNAHRSQASIMARWISDEGELKEEFLDLITMKGCKAADFAEAVEDFCRKFQLQSSNIRFVALDGCNTMSGEKTGLQRRIRHLAPHSLYINCRNHKLALCFVHLVKRQGHLQDVEGLLVSIWKLFNYSAKRHGVFMRMQEIYGERSLSFIRASGTRWLSHLRASARFVDRYEALLDTLDTLIDDTREPELDGIRAKATNHKIVFTILLLTDILKPVNYLSLYLQEDTGFFTGLSERVKACILDLHRIVACYRTRDLEDLEFRRAQSLVDIIEDRTDLQRRLRDQDHRPASPEDYLDSTGIPLVFDLIAEIEDAFSIKSPVLGSFGVLDPCNLPQQATDLPNYGKENIRSLARHYCFEQKDTFQGHETVAVPILDPAVEEELLNFRTHLFMMKTNGVQTISAVTARFMEDPALRMCFPNVLKLYELCSLIPQSTAVVERSFSLMNDLCTMLRTSLSSAHLGSIMRLASCGQPSDNDYEEMVDIFKEKTRVIDF